MTPILRAAASAWLLAATLLRAGAQERTAPPPAAATTPAPPAASALASATFDEAVRRARLHATLSIVAAQEIARADALLVQARSGSLPLLTAGATGTLLDAERKVGANVVAAREQVGANVALSVPVVAASRWTQWAHASQAVGVARASALDAERTAALTAARAYLVIVSQKRAVEVSARAVETARAHRDFARSRREAGIGNALDEARAEQQLAASEAQLGSARAGLLRAQEALGVATGTDGPLDAAAEPALAAGQEPPGAAAREAEQGRADVQAARERASAAEVAVRDSWAEWLPTLLATAQPFLQRPPTLTQPRTGWQAQLILSFPLYEGGLHVGQARERSALADEAHAQLDGLLRQARSEVRTAVGTLALAEAALEQSRRAAERATFALGLVTSAYQAGATTSLDVTDAERQARDADTGAVVAEDAVRQARLDLLAATGHFP